MSSSPTSSSNSDRERLDELVGSMSDVTCDVSVQLGTGRIRMHELLTLAPYTVLRLTEAAGSDLQVVVHGTPVAAGEIVMNDEHTALRVTHVLAPADGRDA